MRRAWPILTLILIVGCDRAPAAGDRVELRDYTPIFLDEPSFRAAARSQSDADAGAVRNWIVFAPGTRLEVTAAAEGGSRVIVGEAWVLDLFATGAESDVRKREVPLDGTTGWMLARDIAKQGVVSR